MHVHYYQTWGWVGDSEPLTGRKDWKSYSNYSEGKNHIPLGLEATPVIPALREAEAGGLL